MARVAMVVGIGLCGALSSLARSQMEYSAGDLLSFSADQKVSVTLEGERVEMNETVAWRDTVLEGKGGLKTRVQRLLLQHAKSGFDPETGQNITERSPFEGATMELGGRGPEIVVGDRARLERMVSELPAMVADPMTAADASFSAAKLADAEAKRFSDVGKMTVQSEKSGFGWSLSFTLDVDLGDIKLKVEKGSGKVTVTTDRASRAISVTLSGAVLTDKNKNVGTFQKDFTLRKLFRTDVVEAVEGKEGGVKFHAFFGASPFAKALLVSEKLANFVKVVLKKDNGLPDMSFNSRQAGMERGLVMDVKGGSELVGLHFVTKEFAENFKDWGTNEGEVLPLQNMKLGNSASQVQGILVRSDCVVSGGQYSVIGYRLNFGKEGPVKAMDLDLLFKDDKLICFSLRK